MSPAELGVRRIAAPVRSSLAPAALDQAVEVLGYTLGSMGPPWYSADDQVFDPVPFVEDRHHAIYIGNRFGQGSRS